MKIFLFGNGGSTFFIFDRLMASKHEVVGICGRQLPWYRGAKTWLSRFLVRSGLKPKDDFLYRDVFDDQPPFRRRAAQQGIPWHGSRGLRAPEFEAMLRTLSPDLCLVASFHRLIPKNILSVPILGTVNFHPGLLPKHRGGTPNRWVLKNGENITGMTAHSVTPEYDTGDILAQVREEVADGDTWGDIERRLAKVAADVAIQVVEDIAEYGVRGTPQNEAEAIYEQSFRREHQFLDWSGSARDIMRTCNAMRPKSGGLTYLDGSLRCLWESETVNGPGRVGKSGETVSFDDAGNPIVRCGGGQLRIRSFLDRGKLISGAEGARRYSIEIGMQFETAAHRK